MPIAKGISPKPKPGPSAARPALISPRRAIPLSCRRSSWGSPPIRSAICAGVSSVSRSWAASAASCGSKILANSRNSAPSSVGGKPCGRASSRSASALYGFSLTVFISSSIPDIGGITRGRSWHYSIVSAPGRKPRGPAITQSGDARN